MTLLLGLFRKVVIVKNNSIDLRDRRDAQTRQLSFFLEVKLIFSIFVEISQKLKTTFPEIVVNQNREGQCCLPISCANHPLSQFLVDSIWVFHKCAFIISHEYNQFFKKQLMNFSEAFNLYGEEDLFLCSSNVHTQESIDVLEPSAWESFSCLHRANSMIYISQFLNLIDEEPITAAKEDLDLAPPTNNGLKNTTFPKDQNVEFKKQKKIKKLQNSPFHNYQKHLNNALKKMIVVPACEENEELYKKVAHEIWIKYLISDIKTKKILHSVFNQRNEHHSSEAELKTYELWEILELYGQKTFNQAKNYLSKLAIDQIDELNIDTYLSTRKLKKRDGFKEYILQFRQELSNGFLKRRINFDQIQN